MSPFITGHNSLLGSKAAVKRAGLVQTSLWSPWQPALQEPFLPFPLSSFVVVVVVVSLKLPSPRPRIESLPGCLGPAACLTASAAAALLTSLLAAHGRAGTQGDLLAWWAPPPASFPPPRGPSLPVCPPVWLQVPCSFYRSRIEVSERSCLLPKSHPQPICATSSSYNQLGPTQLLG